MSPIDRKYTISSFGQYPTVKVCQYGTVSLSSKEKNPTLLSLATAQRSRIFVLSKAKHRTLIQDPISENPTSEADTSKLL
jgi:hypothetical protein